MARTMIHADADDGVAICGVAVRLRCLRWSFCVDKRLDLHSTRQVDDLGLTDTVPVTVPAWRSGRESRVAFMLPRMAVKGRTRSHQQRCQSAIRLHTSSPAHKKRVRGSPKSVRMMCVCATGAIGAHLEMIRKHMTGLPNDRDLDVEVKVTTVPRNAGASVDAGAQNTIRQSASFISVGDRIATHNSEIAVELSA